MSHEELIAYTLYVEGKPKVETEVALRNIAALNAVAEKIDNATSASNNLSSKIFWLNLILTVATVVMAAIEIIKFLKPIG